MHYLIAIGSGVLGIVLNIHGMYQGFWYSFMSAGFCLGIGVGSSMIMYLESRT